MRVLVAHNYYQQPGGEDVVFEREVALLRGGGQEVFEYRRSNAEVDHLPWNEKLRVPARVVWSGDSFSRMKQKIRETRPDVVHFHNTFFMLSPSVYYACRDMGVPVVQSLHNPRLFCPSASFCRQEAACVECLGKRVAWPGVLHGCYRNSRALTAMVAGVMGFHRLLGTWERLVSAYVVFTNFYRQKFVEGGLPEEKIAVKPHFVDPDPGFPPTWRGEYALFLGRLDPEKGVRTLLRAWAELENIPLKIRGAGQLLGEVETFVREKKSRWVEVVGRVSPEDLAALIKGARLLVWPSNGYYETFGLAAIEAFANGVPVIASRSGAMAEIVEDMRTGLHFEPGNARDLAAKVEWAWTHPSETDAMGRQARAEFVLKYTAEQNYRLLIGIYEKALAGR